jgi:hypothetical protein
MSDVRVVGRGSGSASRVRTGGFIAPAATPDGSMYVAPYELSLVQEGRVYIAGDADANDRVTGQTSFADTTPTFLLTVPSGTTCMPLNMFLMQAGTVAGAAIDVNIAISSTSIAYASSGTAEASYCARTDAPNGNALCTLYSGATATTALLTKPVRSWSLAQDVAPAEGAVPEIVWQPSRQGHPILLVGPAALGVFTSAGTTGPTWYWSFSWAEFTTSSMLG